MADGIKIVNADKDKPVFELLEKIRREIHDTIRQREQNRNN